MGHEEKCVEIVQTPITMFNFALGAIQAWFGLHGLESPTPPSKDQIGVLWAQYGIETGAGPWCWNFNIGNVKHVKGDGHNYVMLHKVWEVVKGQRVVFEPPHPATWFRAYESMNEGMAEHLLFLKEKYAPAWEGVLEGDCHKFALLARQYGYYTAPLQNYTNGMLAHFYNWINSVWFEEAMRQFENEPSPDRTGDVVHPLTYDEDEI